MPRGRASNYDEQRDMILAKAAHLFAHGGYPGTSMNQVAEATGLSKATLYHYFRDKYSLLLDITEGHVSRLEALVADVRAQRLPPEDRMRSLIARIMAEYAGASNFDDARAPLGPRDISGPEVEEPARLRPVGRNRCRCVLVQSSGAHNPRS